MNRRTFIKLSTITLLPSLTLAEKEVKPTEPLKWIRLTDQKPEPGQRIIMASRRMFPEDGYTMFIGKVFNHKTIQHKLGDELPNFTLQQEVRLHKDRYKDEIRLFHFKRPNPKYSLRDLKKVQWMRADKYVPLRKSSISMFWSLNDMYWIEDTGTLPKTLPLLPERKAWHEEFNALTFSSCQPHKSKI